MLQNLDSSLWPQILAHVSLTVRTLRILFFTFVFLFLCPTIFTLVAPVCIVYHVCRLSSAAILFPENKIWKGNCWRLVCSQTTEIPSQQSNTLNLGPTTWGAWFCYTWCCKVSDFVTGDVRYLILLQVVSGSREKMTVMILALVQAFMLMPHKTSGKTTTGCIPMSHVRYLVEIGCANQVLDLFVE